jgi:hypothetical protein
MAVQDILNTYETEMNKYSERALHHFQTEDFTQAIQDFSKSFGYEAKVQSKLEEFKKKGFISTDFTKYTEEKHQFLFQLADSIGFIIKCAVALKTNDGEAKYFINFFSKIVQKLSEKRDTLEVYQLEELNSLSNQLSEFEDLKIIVEDSSDNPSSFNPVFSELYQSLEKITNLEMSLVKVGNVSNSDSSCFIATAAYNTSVHTDLDTFRQFRDNKLLPNFFGKRLVTFYYIVGPKLATLVKKNSLIQKAIRTKLESLAKLMREHGFTTR